MPILYFNKNSDSLHKEQIAVLDSLYNIMMYHTNLVVEITVHSGHNEKNPDSLCLQRARRIMDYLILIKQMDSNRISPKGYSDNYPVTLATDHTLMSGKVILTGTKLTKEWIRNNISKKKNPDDYEYTMRLNRRTAFNILRTDFKDTK